MSEETANKSSLFVINKKGVYLFFDGFELCTEEFIFLERKIWDKITNGNWKEGENYVSQSLGTGLMNLFYCINEPPTDDYSTLARQIAPPIRPRYVDSIKKRSDRKMGEGGFNPINFPN